MCLCDTEDIIAEALKRVHTLPSFCVDARHVEHHTYDTYW